MRRHSESCINSVERTCTRHRRRVLPVIQTGDSITVVRDVDVAHVVAVVYTVLITADGIRAGDPDVYDSPAAVFQPAGTGD